MKIYLLASLVSLVAVLATMALTGYIFYRIAKHYFDNQQKMQMLQMRVDEHREAVKLVTPIRLQAYERMALFLERISPESLVLRCYQPGMDTKLLQGVMTKTIRDEWEHNLSAITIPDDADPARLASTIFATVAAGSNPAAPALEFLKQEMRDL